MSVEAQTDPSNRPRYPSVSINTKSPSHLFIVEGEPSEAMNALYESVPDDCKKHLLTIGTKSDGAGIDPVAVSTDTLLLLLAEALPSTAVYLEGSEAFMWDMNVLATKQGMVAEQINMLPPTSNKRRLFCTHCYTIMEDVTHTPAVCSGCGLNLLVRDHFSRLHAAYVGVQIDGEDPADLPEPEELR